MSEAARIVDHLVLIGRGRGGHRFTRPDQGIELFADGTDLVGEDGRDGTALLATSSHAGQVGTTRVAGPDTGNGDRGRP
ncbi:hypothetical protein [Streptomyces sp. NPDC001933]|uniref:hypothetical protein n=1 Tax=Streptomyces sp. NPDC001933 TaxID=3364626 RepID=UPI0036C91460